MYIECSIQSEDENRIFVKIEGRITAANAGQFDQSIRQLISDKPDKSLVLNFEKVDYISSAGLRVILKLYRERQKTLSIINVSDSVGEIFNATGFSDLFFVQKTLDKYRIDGCKKITSAPNGDIYRLNDEMLAKVFHRDVPFTLVKREQQFFHKIVFAGLPTVVPYDTFKTDDNLYGIIYDMPESETLTQTIADDPGCFNEMITKFVELLQQIHSTTGEDIGFPYTKDLYFSYLDGCTGWYTDAELNKLRNLVKSIPERETLVYGNYHPDNILVKDGSLFLIDLSDMSVGHPVFDFLTLVAEPFDTGILDERHTEYHKKMMKEMVQKGRKKLIDQFFKDRSESDLERIYVQIKLLAKLRDACLPDIDIHMPEDELRSRVEDVKQNLIPRIDELKGQIDW